MRRSAACAVLLVAAVSSSAAAYELRWEGSPPHAHSRAAQICTLTVWATAEDCPLRSGTAWHLVWASQDPGIDMIHLGGPLAPLPRSAGVPVRQPVHVSGWPDRHALANGTRRALPGPGWTVPIHIAAEPPRNRGDDRGRHIIRCCGPCGSRALCRRRTPGPAAAENYGWNGSGPWRFLDRDPPGMGS